MRRFKLHQRVVVRHTADGHAVDTPGTVERLRRADDGAWIALDRRLAEGIHPFPADDSRATHVLAYPEDCDLERLRVVREAEGA